MHYQIMDWRQRVTIGLNNVLSPVGMTKPLSQHNMPTDRGTIKMKFHYQLTSLAPGRCVYNLE